MEEKKELENKKVAPRGRQRIKIDILKSDEIFNLFTNEKISLDISGAYDEGEFKRDFIFNE